jgi:hypothetical protein
MSLESELCKEQHKCALFEIIEGNLKIHVNTETAHSDKIKKNVENAGKENNLAALQELLTSSKDELKKAIEAVKESLDDKLPKKENSDDEPVIEKKTDDSKTISRDYAGMMPLPVDDYSRHTSIYKQFFAGHMSHDTSSTNYAEVMDDMPKLSMRSDIDAISYKERKDYVRTIQMNALMGGTHNAVDPKIKEAYEMWKLASKFNQLMSFMMYDSVLSPN